MLEGIKDIIIVMVALGLATISAVGLIWFGYWMGRNSRELPVRSDMNPAKKRMGTKAPIDDDVGDLFQDAAFGYPEEGPGIPTIGGR
jgi:hypothetical protein